MSNVEHPETRDPATGLRERTVEEDPASNSPGRDEPGAWTDDSAEYRRADRRPGVTDRRTPESEHGNGPDQVEPERDDNPVGGALVSDPEGLRRRWESVQVGFVDDPRQAVNDADDLVSAVIEDLADGFRQQRQRLESRSSTGGDGSTDDLRESFRRYRDFFERLLEV